jgi:hypothetical protein
VNIASPVGCSAGMGFLPLQPTSGTRSCWRSRRGRNEAQLAEQIGCTQGFVSQVISSNNLQDSRPSRVTGKDGKSYPASKDALHRVGRNSLTACACGGSWCQMFDAAHSSEKVVRRIPPKLRPVSFITA